MTAAAGRHVYWICFTIDPPWRKGHHQGPTIMRALHSLIPVFAVAGAAFFSAACQRQDASQAPPPPPEVLVAEAATRDVPVYREWTGSLDGSENAEIRARVTGYLTRRDYQEGGLVKKGDLLFEIDPRPFQAALAEAKSQLDQGKAVQLASQATYDRNKQLFDKKVISEQEFTNTTQSNEANIAKVDALQASVDQAQINLNFCNIASPVEGIAGIAQAQVGDLVGTSSGTAPLTTVSTVNPIKVIFPVSESDYLEAIQRVKETLSKPFEERPDSIELILADGRRSCTKAGCFP